MEVEGLERKERGFWKWHALGTKCQSVEAAIAESANLILPCVNNELFFAFIHDINGEVSVRY